jgi:hypothetical protein
MTKTQEILQGALEAQGYEVLQGKGGFWLRGHGHVTTAMARKMTGISPEPRVRRERVAYGDYAALIGFVNRKRG